MSPASLLSYLLRGMHIGLICVAGWYTFLFSLFWLGGQEDLYDIRTTRYVSFVGGRALWSLIVAIFSAAMMISVILCVAWLIRGTTNWPYPLRRLNVFSVCYVLICGTAGFLVIAREFWSG